MNAKEPHPDWTPVQIIRMNTSILNMQHVYVYVHIYVLMCSKLERRLLEDICFRHTGKADFH